MRPFDYLSVLLSIVLGLGITRLLSGLARWLEHRKEVRGYAPTLVWAVVLLLLHVQTWWAMFGLRFWPDWSFLQFSIVLAQPIVLYLLASLAMPSESSPERDLRANFFHHRVVFFALVITLLVVSLVKDIVRQGHLPEWRNLAFHAAFFTTAALALATRRDLHQRILAMVGLILILAYVALLFAELA